MTDAPSILEGMTAGFQNLITQIVTYLPKPAIAILILLLGWMLATTVLQRMPETYLRQILQRCDPTQSSSIILTTVTDVVGFFAFLGIVTLLSSML